ncbi:hypothetical protein [Methylobrevis pamukkalensis]|uniref:Phasin protein n=1 Tax=Methylobrevis pamukkalensis TaxID=1439726 RepID=A0A1E3H899_9HYPH|nr:hypothetical protein [Methylobrevis pamukkalensis]ODN72557.1 hypothetical protein A6302_00048 [Methylobrevis pamukkalensis]
MSRTRTPHIASQMMSLALAPYVAAMRMPSFMGAGTSPAATREVMQAMQEKSDAVMESSRAIQDAMWGMAFGSARAMGAGTFNPMRFAAGHEKAIARVLHPVSRRVQANAVRLSRKSKG